MNADYSNPSNDSQRTCKNSPYASWLVNGSSWTRSAETSGMVWIFDSTGTLGPGAGQYNSEGVRPVITISKSLL